MSPVRRRLAATVTVLLPLTTGGGAGSTPARSAAGQHRPPLTAHR